MLDEVAADVLSLDPLEVNSCSSETSVMPGTGGSSFCFSLFLFLRLRREVRSFENPLGPALAASGTSPACVFGLSVLESIDERPLLRPELSNGSDSADTVQARRVLLPPLRLEDDESAMAKQWGGALSVEQRADRVGRNQEVRDSMRNVESPLGWG